MYIKVTWQSTGKSILVGQFGSKADCRNQLTSRHYEKDKKDPDVYEKLIGEDIVTAQIFEFGPILPPSSIP